MAGLHLFISYSGLDDKYRKRLENHLSVMRRQGLVDIWTDHRIVPGTPFDPVIKAALESADVIILLVTSHFLASEYCWGVELAAAIKRHESGAYVVPVIWNDCDWKTAPFSHLNPLPDKGRRPVTRFHPQEVALSEIAAGIRSIVADVAQRQR